MSKLNVAMIWLLVFVSGLGLGVVITKTAHQCPELEIISGKISFGEITTDPNAPDITIRNADYARTCESGRITVINHSIVIDGGGDPTEGITNLVNSLIADGSWCKVRGHGWVEHPSRTCGVCGKIQSKKEEWIDVE